MSTEYASDSESINMGVGGIIVLGDKFWSCCLLAASQLQIEGTGY